MADFLKVYVKIYSSIFTTASVESQYTDFHLSLNNSNLKCLNDHDWINIPGTVGRQ